MSTSRHALRTGSLCLLALTFALAPAICAQKPAPKDEREEKAQKPAWPKLKYVRKSIAKDKIRHLAGKDEDKRVDARRTILSYGPGVCPVLIESITKRQKPETITEICKLLDELTKREHAPLIAAAYEPGNLPLARWVVARLADFEEKKLAGFFRKASAHKDTKIAEQAKFALARLGDLDSLPFLLELAKEQWEERNVDVRSVLPALKGEPATKDLASRLVTAKAEKEKIACLRLLAGCGTKGAVPAVASYLNSTKHQVRVATVNALRGIVDGKRPYANLTVFNAIAEVKSWKARLGR